MLLELKNRAILLAVLVGSVLLASCGESRTSTTDEDRLPSDGGAPVEAAYVEPAVAVADEETDEPPTTGAISGKPAPPLALASLDGDGAWDLHATLDPTGASCPQGVLLAFMASWCGYCDQSLATLKELQDSFPELAVVVVDVDDRPEGQQTELNKVRDAGLTGPVLLADAATRAAWLGPGGTVPRYAFVNRMGTVVAQDRGFGDKVKPKMPGQARRALLAGP
ncbi:MAG: TlpA family protein disulfide reductase [Myxococcota bacterium]